MRRTRRYNNTPYRKCRSNRACLKRGKRLPPSTKARWDAKLRVIAKVSSMFPITKIMVEDIKAKTKPGNKKWNQTFSTLQVGKHYFYTEIDRLYPNVELKLASGIETSEHRKARGFGKTTGKAKLSYVWESHNSDSHSLAEIALGCLLHPERSMYKIRFMQFSRRDLHFANLKKGGIRQRYGGTVSHGFIKGSVVRDSKTNRLYTVGGHGEENGRKFVSIHDIETNDRINSRCNINRLTIMYKAGFACTFQKAA